MTATLELLEASRPLVEALTRRPLRRAEQAIDVFRLDRALNDAKDDLEDAIRSEMLAATAAWVAGMAVRPALHVTPEMDEILGRLHALGQEEALNELERLGYRGVRDTAGERRFVTDPGPGPDRDVGGYVRRELPNIEHRIQDELVAADLAGASSTAIAQALLRVPGARDIASRVVSTALMGGMSLTFEQNAGLIRCWEYSAILDAGTCPACAPLDGKRYSSLAEVFRDLPQFGPNPGCHGGGRCRCRAVPCAVDDVGQNLPLASKTPTTTPTESVTEAAPETAAQLGKRLNDLYDPWAESLTDAELEAIQTYQGAGFRRINAGLRQGTPIVKQRGGFDPKEVIRGTDKAIAKAEVPEQMTVYRGVSNYADVFGTTDLDKLVGQTFVDNGYVSTTVSKTKADEFSKFGAAATIEIEVPPGATAAWMPKVAAGRDASRIRAERELLLPRGSRFEILEVQDSGRGRVRIRARLIP